MPTFEDWFNCQFPIKCKAEVICTDGTVQDINDCNLNYGFQSKAPIISKRGYLISDFFFVRTVIHYHSFEIVAL